jgi:hypothetical protein
MEARLIFNLPEEQMEFNRANQSLDMACALFDILQLRKAMERRYSNYIDNTNNDVFDGIDAMAEGISKILEEHNINIDKLIE